MKQWFSKLKFVRFTKIDGREYITELNKYADYTFGNGIYIRVVTGDMAHTNTPYPYEVIIHDPIKGKRSVPMLNQHGVRELMDKLNNTIIE
jgi:hypothetical protein